MGLSNELITQFVKATKDSAKPKDGTTVYGTIVYDGKPYVRIDGSELLTPITSTTDVKDGERVTVLVKDHTAVVTGNMTSPAARTDDVKELNKQVTEFETVVAYKVSTEDLEAAHATIEALRAKLADITDLDVVYADIYELEAKFANLSHVNADEVEALNASIEKIQAHFGDFENISAEELEALNAEITTLRGYTASFTYLSAASFSALKADIKNLDTKYAIIDFSNIGEAAVEKLFAESGIIDSLTMKEGKVTGELIGVEISGDLIKGNTIMADSLIIKGEDGLYHRLNVAGGVTATETLTEDDLQNGLHGSVIIARSITADKVEVSDLVAFDAKIGGFEITDDSIHSGTKESVDNGTPGVYMDSSGQFAVGDSSNYIKFYDEGGIRKLAIAAESISTEIKDATEALKETTDNVNKHFTFDGNGLTIKAGENEMSIKISNDIIEFYKGSTRFGSWDGINFNTGNIAVEVEERAQFGNFAYVPRKDGSLSFLKVEHRTGFYAIVSGGIMSIYGSYPTLDGNTMVIPEDIPGELDGTTLVLNGGQ